MCKFETWRAERTSKHTHRTDRGAFGPLDFPKGLTELMFSLHLADLFFSSKVRVGLTSFQFRQKSGPIPPPHPHQRLHTVRSNRLEMTQWKANKMPEIQVLQPTSHIPVSHTWMDPYKVFRFLWDLWVPVKSTWCPREAEVWCTHTTGVPAWQNGHHCSVGHTLRSLQQK